MRQSICLMFLVIAVSSCNNEERERALKSKSDELERKEQLLLAKEQRLQVKEQELQNREMRLDSSRVDTSFVLHPEIVGKWDVKMTCVEADCPGNAVGDTKTEQWEIGYQGRSIIAKALVKDAVTRAYTGSYEGDMLTLISQSYATDLSRTTVMHIKLHQVADGRLEGTREIDRPDNCRIVYEVQLTRQ